MGHMYHHTKPFWGLVLMLVFLPSIVLARKITVLNSCKSTVWPGMHTGGNNPPNQPTGWELAAGQSTSFVVAEDWTAGRIWARTGCSNVGELFQCLTGACGAGAGSGGVNGDMTCAVGHGDEPPASLAEFTLSATGEDNYDVSLVDGFNIPMNIVPSDTSCPQANCEGNINALCPPVLRTGIDDKGVNYGCLTACNAGLGQEKFGNRACCTGAYVNATLCTSCGVDYYDLYKSNCGRSYAYAYDEKSGTALWTCASKPDYVIVLCPAGSDYVGVKTPSNSYIANTATCSSMATTFSQTFSVGPSPTASLQSGTLSVQATVSAGAGGAAAFATDGSSSSSSALSSSSRSSATSTSVQKMITQTVVNSIIGPTIVSTQTVTKAPTGAVLAETAKSSSHKGKYCKGGQYLSAVGPGVHKRSHRGLNNAGH